MTTEPTKQAQKCLVCGNAIEEPKVSSYKQTVIHRYSCQRCGDFCLDGRTNSLLPYTLESNVRRIGVLSHWIRTKHESIQTDKLGHRETILLDEDLVDSIIKRPPPSPGEQADNLVRWLGETCENTDARGQEVGLQPATHMSILGSLTQKEYEWVVRHLIETGILQGRDTGDMRSPGRFHVTLSFEGWEHYQDLKRGATDSRKAFMAMQYGNEQLNKVVEEVFKPAVKQTGFDLVRLDEKPKAGLIDDRLRVEIQTSRFLIADLTDENAGAYWEAGYAEGLGKPVIYTCEKGKFEESKSHFDTNHHLTITWDATSAEEAAEELKATIRATLAGEAKLTDE